MMLRASRFCTPLGSLALLSALFATSLSGQPATTTPAPAAWNTPGLGNPILPGYFADPSLLQDKGHFYLYATLDPWGDKTLGCWQSTDLVNWTYLNLNWPTKSACTSPSSKQAMVWAPSVVAGADGKYHMFVSVGSEVWAGVAENPAGPWRNALADNKPLVPATWNTSYHMIDAEAFVDEDGTPYLYWGSGWNWKDGHCFVVKLNRELNAFEGEPRDITPPNYFEGPFTFKRNGKYYLSYSKGRTDQDSYQVHYAVSDSPLGPFTEPSPEPILATDSAAGLISPGHHAVFMYQNQHYILYHRQALPWDPKTVLRQVCADRLSFKEDGGIAKVAYSHQGPFHDPARTPREGLRGIPGLKVKASSESSPACPASAVSDDNYATRWCSANSDDRPWLSLDLGDIKRIEALWLRPEFPWKKYAFSVHVSDDKKDWTRVANFLETPAAGSPIRVDSLPPCRYIHIQFSTTTPGAARPSFWEIGLEERTETPQALSNPFPR